MDGVAQFQPSAGREGVGGRVAGERDPEARDQSTFSTVKVLLKYSKYFQTTFKLLKLISKIFLYQSLLIHANPHKS